MRKVCCFLIVAAGAVTACGTAPTSPSNASSRDPSRMSYTRIYCTPDNESHFGSVETELAKVNAAPPAMPFFAKGSQASRMAFAAFDSGWGAQDLSARKYHPAPFAQYVVYLSGAMSITTSDGDTREFRAGDVLRVEDVAPCKGHISVVGEQPTHTLIVR